GENRIGWCPRPGDRFSDRNWPCVFSCVVVRCAGEARLVGVEADALSAVHKRRGFAPDSREPGPPNAVGVADLHRIPGKPSFSGKHHAALLVLAALSFAALGRYFAHSAKPWPLR